MCTHDRDVGSRPAAGRDFHTTRWSVVLSAGCHQSAGSAEALNWLCEAYWFPLYTYVRRRVEDVHEARDLTQAFFAELLEKNYVGAATPRRGRFRAFLLTALKHFLSKQWEKAKAQKRGGGRAAISLDFDSADSRYRTKAALKLSPDQLYEREWAVTLLEQIIRQLHSELLQAGKVRQFEKLKPFLIGDHSETTYARVAEELNITEAAAKMAAHRLRRRYRALLREAIAQTVAGPEEVDDEMRNLFSVLAL